MVARRERGGKVIHELIQIAVIKTSVSRFFITRNTATLNLATKPSPLTYDKDNARALCRHLFTTLITEHIFRANWMYLGINEPIYSMCVYLLSLDVFL